MSCNPIINIPCCTDPEPFDCGSLLFNSSDDSVLITTLGDCDFNFQVNPALLVETPISQLLTSSLIITVSGPEAHTIRGDVRISAAIGNNLIVNGDGLYIGGNAVYTDANARAAISGVSPIVYSQLLGTISIQQATALQDGYLDNADWTIFNNKLSGVANLAGAGETLFTTTVANVAQLKRLVAGTNITLTPNASDITINAANLSETDTLATVVARGGIVNLPITIQGLTLSGVPVVGTLADDLLVRDVAGIVKTIPTSSFLTAEVDTLDAVTDRSAVTTNVLSVGGITSSGAISGTTVAASGLITGDEITVTTDINGVNLFVDQVVSDGMTLAIRSVAVNTVVLVSDFTILVDTTSGSINITFNPALSGKVIAVKKITADVNTVTILPLTGTIDGAASHVMTADQESAMIQADGTNLYII